MYLHPPSALLVLTASFDLVRVSAARMYHLDEVYDLTYTNCRETEIQLLSNGFNQMCQGAAVAKQATGFVRGGDWSIYKGLDPNVRFDRESIPKRRKLREEAVTAVKQFWKASVKLSGKTSRRMLVSVSGEKHELLDWLFASWSSVEQECRSTAHAHKLACGSDSLVRYGPDDTVPAYWPNNSKGRRIRDYYNATTSVYLAPQIDRDFELVLFDPDRRLGCDTGHEVVTLGEVGGVKIIFFCDSFWDAQAAVAEDWFEWNYQKQSDLGRSFRRYEYDDRMRHSVTFHWSHEVFHQWFGWPGPRKSNDEEYYGIHDISTLNYRQAATNPETFAIYNRKLADPDPDSVRFR